MKKFVLLSLVIALRCASAQDATAVDAKTLLSALKEMKTKHAESAKSQFGKMMQDLGAASASNASAIAFYEEATRAITFAGQTREKTLFQEWKKKEADHLKSVEMQTAVRLHLSYLLITLQHANGLTIPQVMPSLLRYSDMLTAAPELVSTQDILRQSVNASIFLKWYGSEKILGNVHDWEMNPGNLDGIWRTTILPQMRKEKDQRAILYWDNKLKLATDAAAETKRVFDVDQFRFIRKPALLWSRAKDLIAIGQRNRGISEMFNIVKNWPDHPNNAAWIAKLEGILSGTDTGADPGSE